ncbi:MAG TPA: 30S ribosomal protein S16 [Patescibacteria group bacterium]|nr:30S ribosomal protein S16 [Patescibacteria group bacterium]
MLRIKLVKTGKKDRPTWRVVVVEKTRTGKGAVTDYIGNYNPHLHPKEFKLDIEKYDKWVGSGAQPTDTVKRLKGKMIDKTKDYQKEVEIKVYKSKKPEEAKKEAPKPAEKKEETKEEIGEIKGEPVVEDENVQTENVEANGGSSEETVVEDKKAEEKAE